MHSGNSKSKIISIGEKYFFEKSFPRNNEIQFYNEFFIHYYLTNFSKQFTVPLIKKDSRNLKLVYEYMPRTKNIDNSNSKQYFEIIKNIHLKTYNDGGNKLFAKEALISNKVCIDQIKYKISLHKKNKLSLYISKEYKFFIEKLENLFSKIIPYFENISPKSNLFFNHADSGIHNCALDNDNNIRLVDLEYAGYDSPIKQHIDFLIHPRNLNEIESRYDWSNYFIEERICEEDLINLNIYNSLFSIKWALIIMNEFLSDNWKVRVYADPSRNERRGKILFTQLKKANLYLIASQKLLDNARFDELFSKSEIILISKSY